MGLAAGELNRRITIQKRVQGQHDDGQPFDDWVDVATVWASIKTLSGLGTIKAANDVPLSVSQYSFQIRYRRDLDAGMRSLLDGVPYDITLVKMDEARREWTDLVCNRGANNG
jgi:SPP1 family predicted phage head-tail adaptor